MLDYLYDTIVMTIIDTGLLLRSMKGDITPKEVDYYVKMSLLEAEHYREEMKLIFRTVFAMVLITTIFFVAL